MTDWIRPFTWIDGERLIRFAPGALGEAPRLLAERGFERYALLTTERAAASAPALVAGSATMLHVPLGPVPDAAAAVRGEVGDRPLVALGGGRVIDSAKAIAGADGLDCAAIPTTLSGAELTRFHRMPAGVDRFTPVRPSLVVADPAVMASQPAPGIVASALNAMAHAVEALYTPLANPVAWFTATHAITLLGFGLSPAEPRRDELALGALLAGWASGTTGYALHHVLCQTIVRVGETPHAETNAVMLPHVLRAMADRAPRAMQQVAGALGTSGDPATRVADLSARTGKRRLADLGFDASLAGRVAAEATGRPELHNTPRPPDEAELRALVEAAA